MSLPEYTRLRWKLKWREMREFAARTAIPVTEGADRLWRLAPDAPEYAVLVGKVWQRASVSFQAIKSVEPVATQVRGFLKPGITEDTEEALAKAAGEIGTTIFHPVGTCKMGQDSMAVVDANLRVYGIQGLRVADASIMPTITSGNTNSPTMVIAEKAAQMMLAQAT